MRRHKTSLRNFIETMSSHHDVINVNGEDLNSSKYVFELGHETPLIFKAF